MKISFLPIVTLSALLIALYSVISEATMNAFGVTPLIVGGIPTLIGGVILLIASFKKDRNFFQKIDRISWLKIVVNGLCSAAGIFFWFDSVARIGAGKEMLLSTSTTETLFVLLLSFIFLREKLRRRELMGSAIILLGIFMALYSPDALTLSFKLGDAEAVMSSLLFAIAIVIAADVLKRYNPTVVGGIYS